MATHRIHKMALNLTGCVFGQLTVIEYAGMSNRERKRPLWKCRCACGGFKTATVTLLRAGQCNQCDTCLRRRLSITSHRHGYYKRPEYRSWAQAIQRCNNPRASHYSDYGGRGIRICDRWKNSFIDFIADMGPMPVGCDSLDRYPDQNGDYAPGNCRWANQYQQMSNMRKNVIYEYDGKRLCLSEWARVSGIKRATLDARLCRGWSFARAISEPLSDKYEKRGNCDSD